MTDIARIAGVSLGTVSHVLNGTANVREPRKKRVLEAIDALGYQPSQLARGLRRVKTNIIGMIIPDISNPFFPCIVRGAEDIAFSRGYRLILCNTDNDHAKELLHLNALRTYLPAGLIIIPSNFSDLKTQSEIYQKAGTSIVCVDRLPRHWEGDTVMVGNEEGAYNATHYLLQLGHTKVATVAGPHHLTNAKERLAGFKRALHTANIPLPPEYIQVNSFDRVGGYQKTKRLLSMIPRPTAIFAANDLTALGCIMAIRDSGIRCPEDISVMGFDDLEFAEIIQPSLTTMSQSGYQLGTTAAGLVIDRVEGDLQPPQHVVLGTELKIRQSVAAPPPPPRKAGVGSKARK